MAQQTPKQIYDNFCRYFSNRELEYEKDDEKLTIRCAVHGDDLPFTFVVLINEDLNILCVLTYLLGCEFPQDKIIDAAVAVSMANVYTVDGGFDLDIESGTVLYRVTTSFSNMEITDGIMDNMIEISGGLAEMYNDKFAALAEGRMDIDDFIDVVRQ